MRRMLSFLFLLFICSLSISAGASDRFTIGTGLKPPLVSGDGMQGFLDTLAKELFARMGMELDVIILPSERALVNANNGIEDGNLLRIKGLEERYPNLVRVPEKLMDTEFVGYAMKDIPMKPGWERLSGMIVSYPNGWVIFDKNTASAGKREIVRVPDQMFQLLKEGKIDIALYEKWQGIVQAKKADLQGFQVLDPPFVTVEQFMYFNKKHKELAQKAADILKEMKIDGTYDRIRARTLGHL